MVGLEVPNFPSIPWAQWNSANPLDYQGLVLDLRDSEFRPHQVTIATALLDLVNNSHSAYVILPDAKSSAAQRGAMTFIPNYYVYVEPAVGQTLNVRPVDPFFDAYRAALTGHEICVKFQQLTNHPAGWPIYNAVVDNVSRIICCKLASIYVLHPPAKKLEQKALKAIIEHFKPDPPPVSSVAKPSWVETAAAKIPGVAELQAIRASLTSEIQKKSEELSLHDEKLRAAASCADLLWLEGLSLQAKVGEALNFLGLTAGSNDPSGYTGDLYADESGTQFVFEVTGSTGTIGIEKGRQLVQWVAEAPDPTTAKGVLIASAFRNEPPEKRPPSPDKRIFVVEVERLAERFHLALLDIRELYRVVCAKLAGNTIEKTTIVKGLLTDGVVKFQI